MNIQLVLLNKIVRWLAVLLIIFSTTSAAAFWQRSWEDTYQLIEEEFPQVRHINADALTAQLADKTAEVVLLDVRENEEFTISHLQQAKRALTIDEALTVLGKRPVSTKIIVYCSVGYRSSQLAQQLRERGYSNIANLKGGIFSWANDAKPLRDDQGQTRFVHPYSRDWGRLLKAELHRWP